MKLQGITAIVTGSGGSLGREIALGLACAGASCICHYYKGRSAAEELVEHIRSAGGQALAIDADLADQAQIERFFRQVENSDFVPPSVLVNCAAVFSRQPAGEITFEQTRRIFDVNTIGPLMMCRDFVGLLSKKNSSSSSSSSAASASAVQYPIAGIINIADTGGLRPWANYSVYCASKAALISITKSLAKELAPAITVNAVAPGIVTWPADFGDNDRQRQLAHIPAGRIAAPQEIVQAVLFILQNDYITGQVINIDGGRCI